VGRLPKATSIICHYYPLPYYKFISSLKDSRRIPENTLYLSNMTVPALFLLTRPVQCLGTGSFQMWAKFENRLDTNKII
jgi:hypothetical protein